MRELREGCTGSAPWQECGISLHRTRGRVGSTPAVPARRGTDRAINCLSVLLRWIYPHFQALNLLYRHPLTYTSVNRPSQQSYGFCEDVEAHTPQRSPFSIVTPSSRRWCPSVSAIATLGPVPRFSPRRAAKNRGHRYSTRSFSDSGTQHSR